MELRTRLHLLAAGTHALFDIGFDPNQHTMQEWLASCRVVSTGGNFGIQFMSIPVLSRQVCPTRESKFGVRFVGRDPFHLSMATVTLLFAVLGSLSGSSTV